MSTETEWAHAMEFVEDDGWWVAVCDCGWKSLPNPGRSDCADVYGDHRASSATEGLEEELRRMGVAREKLRQQMADIIRRQEAELGDEIRDLRLARRPLESLPLDGTWELMHKGEDGQPRWLPFTPRHHLASVAADSAVYVIARVRSESDDG